MSLKADFRSSDARKRFISKMDAKWERKFKQHVHDAPSDGGFKYFEYLED